MSSSSEKRGLSDIWHGLLILEATPGLRIKCPDTNQFVPKLHHWAHFSLLWVPVSSIFLPWSSPRCFLQVKAPASEEWRGFVRDYQGGNRSFCLKQGRLTLWKSASWSLHIYCMTWFIILGSMDSQMEKIMRTFLWCITEPVNRFQWVTCKDVCVSLQEGGLGTGSLRMGSEGQVTWEVCCLQMRGMP